MKSITCVIIEDEIASQELLSYKLNELFPEIDIIKIIDNVPEAISYLKIHTPDFIFLDNQLKGGYGIQLLQELNEIHFDIIFLTAHADYALQAFRYNAIHYLLKPLITSDFIDAVDRILTKRKKNFDSDKKLFINSQNESYFIPHSQIIYLQSSGAYTELISRNKKYTISKNLGKLEAEIDSEKFIRINHSHLVNRIHIQSVEKGKQAFLILKNEDKLPISQRKYTSVITLLEKE